MNSNTNKEEESIKKTTWQDDVNNAIDAKNLQNENWKNGNRLKLRCT